MAQSRRSLGQILIDQGLLTPADLRRALRVGTQPPERPLAQVLVDLKLVSEDAVVEAQAAVVGVEYVRLRRTNIDSQAIKAVPFHLLQRHTMLPIAREGSTLVVAMVEPTERMFADLRQLGLVCRPVMASRAELAAALAQLGARSTARGG